SLSPPSSTAAFLLARATSFFCLFLPRARKPSTGFRPTQQQLFREEGSNRRAMNVEHEVNLLVEEIHRLGSKNADGKLSVKFGVLFQDDRCANLFEALVGTLKAAKRRKIVTYAGELLLQGVHDDVDIVLLQD
ncbi:mCG7517, isoform CRA_c, partial [Mus musculus]